MESFYNQFSLTPLILACQETGRDMERVINGCSLYVWRKLRDYPMLDEDMRQEFFVAFFPYLKKMVAAFEDKGIPFEIVINYILKHRVKSFFRSFKRLTLLWDITADPSLAPAYQGENQTTRTPIDNLALLMGIGMEGTIAASAGRKRFLIWTLSQARTLTDHDIRLTGRLTGYDVAWIANKAMFLRDCLVNKEQRLAMLTGRRNSLFLKCRMIELRILRELDEKIKRMLYAKLAKKRASLANVMRIISRVPLSPSHRMIARAVGIPKGSVDSMLARFKRILRDHLCRDMRRSARTDRLRYA